MTEDKICPCRRFRLWQDACEDCEYKMRLERAEREAKLNPPPFFHTAKACIDCGLFLNEHSGQRCFECVEKHLAFAMRFADAAAKRTVLESAQEEARLIRKAERERP